MNQRGRRIRHFGHPYHRHVLAQETCAAGDMGQGKFGAILHVRIVVYPQIADVVKQRRNHTQTKQLLTHRLDADATALVTVDQACHGERDVENMLDVVIRRIAGKKAGECTRIHQRRIAKCSVQRCCRSIRIEIVKNPLDFRLYLHRICRSNRFGHVVFIADRIHALLQGVGFTAEKRISAISGG